MSSRPHSERIEDAIDRWHEGDPAGEGLSLHEYLGWTWEEYKAYAERGYLSPEPHQPKRDDEIAAWLSRMRDAIPQIDHTNAALDFVRSGNENRRQAIDGLLNRYRECADHGLTLRPYDDGQGDP